MDSQSVSLQSVMGHGCTEVHYTGVCLLSLTVLDADNTQVWAAIVNG